MPDKKEISFSDFGFSKISFGEPHSSTTPLAIKITLSDTFCAKPISCVTIIIVMSLKNSDITMIIVTHEMGFAQKVSDKVIFMANGVVEECGSPKEIFENPKSEKLISFLSGIKNKDGD